VFKNAKAVYGVVVSLDVKLMTHNKGKAKIYMHPCIRHDIFLVQVMYIVSQKLGLPHFEKQNVYRLVKRCVARQCETFCTIPNNLKCFLKHDI
jgi:hypothetical protein